MQRTAVFLLAFVGTSVAVNFEQEKAKALVARVWLRAHAGAPNVDELAELKDQNPEAYAIVKALLTKRSLGLLNPRHPTASFANGGVPQEDESVPRGPAVFAKFASKTELAKMHTSDDAVYPEVQDAPVASPHHDWLNWRPTQSAADDDTMVKNVLGSVAELTSAKSQPQGRKSLLGQSRGEVMVASPPSTRLAAPKIEPISASSSDEANEYLDSIGGFSNNELGNSKEASLLKKSSHEDSNTNYLSSFSWGDSQQKQQQQSGGDATSVAASPLMRDAADLLPEPAPETKKVAAPAAPLSAGPAKGALLKWLR